MTFNSNCDRIGFGSTVVGIIGVASIILGLLAVMPELANAGDIVTASLSPNMSARNDNAFRGTHSAKPRLNKPIIDGDRWRTAQLTNVCTFSSESIDCGDDESCIPCDKYGVNLCCKIYAMDQCFEMCALD